jgi:outer membrane lipoprotein-sorting protein
MYWINKTLKHKNMIDHNPKSTKKDIIAYAKAMYQHYILADKTQNELIIADESKIFTYDFLAKRVSLQQKGGEVKVTEGFDITAKRSLDENQYLVIFRFLIDRLLYKFYKQI